MSERYDIHPADGRRGKYLSVPFLYSGVPDHSNAGKPEFRVWQWLQVGHRRRTGSWLLSFYPSGTYCHNAPAYPERLRLCLSRQRTVRVGYRNYRRLRPTQAIRCFSYYMLSGWRVPQSRRYFYTDRFSSVPRWYSIRPIHLRLSRRLARNGCSCFYLRWTSGWIRWRPVLIPAYPLLCIRP